MINLFNGSTLLFPFFLIAASIGVFSYFLSVYTIAIEQKTKLNSGFIGIVLLALTTSLPEMVTAFLSPVLSNPEYATFNMFGSNTLTQTALVLSFILFFNKDIFNRFSKTNKKTNLALVISSLLFVL